MLYLRQERMYTLHLLLLLPRCPQMRDVQLRLPVNFFHCIGVCWFVLNVTDKKVPIHYQKLSHYRQILMSPSDRVVCLTGNQHVSPACLNIQHAPYSSDTRHRPIVKSKSACCFVNWFDQTVGRQCLINSRSWP